MNYNLDYKELYNNFPSGYLCSLPNGTIIDCNKKFLDLINYTREEIIGKKKFTDFLSLGEKIYFENIYFVALKLNGTVEEVTFNFIKKDDTKLPVLVNSVEVKDKEGLHLFTQSAIFNISQRKKYEQELLVAKRKANDLSTDLERIFNLSGYMVGISSPDGTFQKVSPAFTETLGFSEKELLSKPFVDFVHPDDKEATIKQLEPLSRVVPIIRFRNRSICKDGSFKWLEWTARSFVNDGDIYAIAVDITEKKQKTEELIIANKNLSDQNKEKAKRTEELTIINRDLVNQNEAQKLAQIGSWLFNPSSQKNEWSDEMFHIWGFDLKKGAPESESIANRIHTDDFELYDSSVSKAIKLGSPYNIEFRIVLPNNEHKTIRAICQPIFDDNGKVVSLSGTNQDMTTHKLFEAAQVKHQRIQAMGEMAASIAHDFNNSLQEMTGNLEIIKLQNDLSDKAIDRLNNIGSIIRDVAGRVTSLQKFGDPEYDDKNQKSIDFNTSIRDSLNESRPLWRGEVERKGFSINIITELEELPKISCNSGELKSALHNIIKNSVEAMPEGGDLIIKTGINTKGIFATFNDTGIGMDEETKLKIFEPFYSTKGLELGRGLGMSGVYNIIRKHKGDIAVNFSELGKGTIIEITFPINQIIEDPIVIKTKQKSKESFTALWVDDDTMITESASMLVEMMGHKCDSVNSARAALEYLNKNNCEIVFTDIGMPEMNGYELVAAIKNKFGDKIKIIVVSGWHVDDITKEELGIDFVLNKPFTMEELQKIFQVV